MQRRGNFPVLWWWEATAPAVFRDRAAKLAKTVDGNFLDGAIKIKTYPQTNDVFRYGSLRSYFERVLEALQVSK